MKQIHTYLTLIGFLGAVVTYAQRTTLLLDPAVISSTSLYNTAQKKPGFITWNTDKPLHLFVFLSPDCPLCRNYAPILNSLEIGYRNQVQVYGIIPGRSYPDSLINEFISTFSVQYPVLKDNGQQLKKYFNASTTPEVYLLDDTGALLYQGAIDNWAVALGKKRVKATEHYLLDAVKNSSDNIPVVIKYAQPVGCIINDY